MIFEHKSVLLYETVDSLNIKPDGIYVDGTLGGGGHAYEVLKRLGLVGLALLYSGQTGLAAVNWKAVALAAVLLVLTRWCKPTKGLHPIVFILASAIIGVVFSF